MGHVSVPFMGKKPTARGKQTGPRLRGGVRAVGEPCAPSNRLRAVLLAYVDESYTADMFFLGALVVDGDAASEIESGLNALVDEYRWDAKLLRSDVELHGYPLFHGKEGWAEVGLRARINIYERSMKIVGASGARIVLRGMDVKRQRERYARPDPPHEVVLGHTLERVNTVATRERTHALVLADEVHSDERHRSNFRNFRIAGTPGYLSSRLPRLVDTIHFAPSHHSRLLQAVDLVTFLHRRRSTVQEPDPRASEVNDRIWAHIENSIEHCWTWVP